MSIIVFSYTNVVLYYFVGDALRIISAGGFYLNQSKAANPAEVIVPSVHKLDNNLTVLRVGKRNYYIVKWIS